MGGMWGCEEGGEKGPAAVHWKRLKCCHVGKFYPVEKREWLFSRATRESGRHALCPTLLSISVSVKVMGLA